MIWLETTAIADESADSTAAKGPKHMLSSQQLCTTNTFRINKLITVV